MNNSLCQNTGIQDDNFIEDMEYFFVMLTSIDAVDTTGVSRVTITDNDGTCTHANAWLLVGLYLGCLSQTNFFSHQTIVSGGFI